MITTNIKPLSGLSYALLNRFLIDVNRLASIQYRAKNN